MRIVGRFGWRPWLRVCIGWSVCGCALPDISTPGASTLGGLAITCVAREACPTFYLPGGGAVRTASAKTGGDYVDVSLDFAPELKGPGTVVVASDTRGIRLLGNVNDCLPTEMKV